MLDLQGTMHRLKVSIQKKLEQAIILSLTYSLKA